MGGIDSIFVVLIATPLVALAAFFLLRGALRAFGRAFKRTVWYRPPGPDEKD